MKISNIHIHKRWWLSILIVLQCICSFAQITTGKLQGYITDTTDYAVSGANIIVVNTENGAKYFAVSQSDGYYSLDQLPPYSHYEVNVTFIGYKNHKIENVTIQLGEITVKNIVLVEDNTNLSEVIITVDKNDPFQNPKKGNETTITADLILKTPTLNRSFQDATRLMPESNLNSFGGANYRFNNLSIDGLATNDVLGFQEPASGAAGSIASGTPGGLAGTQPIGYGAIEALSVKISPFDVSYGNFTGASINAVTKSGTNETKGNVYGYGRNQWLIGKYAGGIKEPSAEFYDFQTGFSLGGALKKNKIFYFANIEFAKRNEPVLNAPGSENSNFPIDVIKQISDTLIKRYDYDPGEYSNVSLLRSNAKLFFRIDYSISDKHKLVLRDNFVNGYADNLEWSSNFFNFGNQGYRHHSKTNSFVAELKSSLGKKMTNKLIVGHTFVNDERTYDGKIFPHLEITYNTVNTIFAGTYREAAIYGLKLNTFQVSDNLSIYFNKHTVTTGLSSEFNDISYRFLTAWNGRWQYKSPTDFFNDSPSRIRGVYNVGNNDFDYNKNTPSAIFLIMLLGAYIQDEYRLSKKITLTAGLRIDMQYHPGNFPVSSELSSTPEFSNYNNQINAHPQINPRISFNYFPGQKNNLQMRGGSGFFTGRIPFVWYAYAQYISGTTYFNIDYKPSSPIALTENLSDLASLQPSLTEINLIDNNFKLPKDWKNNLAIDIKLNRNYIINIEGTYSKVLSGLLFQSINFKDSIGNFSGTDNRPYYLASGSSIKINPDFTNVFLLTNTNKGYRYNVTVGLSKKEKIYSGYIGYSLGQSKDISSTVRNSHAANYEWNQAIIANDPELSFSNFDLRHKIITYHFIEYSFEKSKISAGLLYNGRSGSPFSFVYEGDINRDGSAKNDLIYIPAQQSDIIFSDILDANGNVLVSVQQQWEQLNQYIEENNYLKANRGSYAMRNGARTPWNHQLDARLSYTVNGKKRKAEINLDIINILNLINKNLGSQYFVSNTQNSGYGLIEFVKIENGNPVFQFKNPEGTPWVKDPIFSRWQMQLGVNIIF